MKFSAAEMYELNVGICSPSGQKSGMICTLGRIESTAIVQTWLVQLTWDSVKDMILAWRRGIKW